MGKIINGLKKAAEWANPLDGDRGFTIGNGLDCFTSNKSEAKVNNSGLLKAGSLIGGGILGGKLGKNLGGPLGGVIGLAGGAIVMRKLVPELAADVAATSDYGAKSGKGFKLKALATNVLNFSGQTYDGKKGEAEKD